MRLNQKATKSVAACLAAAGVFAAATSASAANPPCSAPTVGGTVGGTALPGTVVVFTGSSASKPMLRRVSKLLGTLMSGPVRLVYQSVGSCQGLSDITTQTMEPTTGTYWDETTPDSKDPTLPSEYSCTPDNVAGIIPDVAVSDVFPTSCANITVPADQADFTGSAQVFNFIVPPSSSENVISMEAAYVVYGWGAVTNIINPWNDASVIFRRAPTSGTYTMLTKLIGLDISKLKGTCPDGMACKAKTGDIVTAVHNADATKPNAAIGIASSDFADSNRMGTPGAVKILAYQHKGAACGVYPDTDANSYDKFNVRNGYYPFWGPLHYVTKVDGMGNPTNANVTTALSYFTRKGLTDPAALQSMIDFEVAAFTVPQCAMNVKRTSEVAPTDSGLVPQSPDTPCGCYYTSKATKATPSSCTACMNDTPCGSGKCRYGFCEAK